MKLTKKQLAIGMKFEVISLEYSVHGAYDWPVFGNTESPAEKTQIGDIIEITEEPETGSNYVHWQNTRTKRNGQLEWSRLKDATNYIGGTVPKPVSGVVITSSGPFNGFDMVVAKQRLNKDEVTSINIWITFVGTFKGGKRITTKMINDIKNSPGFEITLYNLLAGQLDEPGLTSHFISLPPAKSPLYEYAQKRRGYVYYDGGSVAFGFLLHNDPDQTKRNIKQFISGWQKSKKTEYVHAF